MRFSRFITLSFLVFSAQILPMGFFSRHKVPTSAVIGLISGAATTAGYTQAYGNPFANKQWSFLKQKPNCPIKILGTTALPEGDDFRRGQYSVTLPYLHEVAKRNGVQEVITIEALAKCPNALTKYGLVVCTQGNDPSFKGKSIGLNEGKNMFAWQQKAEQEGAFDNDAMYVKETARYIVEDKFFEIVKENLDKDIIFARFPETQPVYGVPKGSMKLFQYGMKGKYLKEMLVRLEAKYSQLNAEGRMLEEGMTMVLEEMRRDIPGLKVHEIKDLGIFQIAEGSKTEPGAPVFVQYH